MAVHRIIIVTDRHHCHSRFKCLDRVEMKIEEKMCDCIRLIPLNLSITKYDRKFEFFGSIENDLLLVGVRWFAENMMATITRMNRIIEIDWEVGPNLNMYQLFVWQLSDLSFYFSIEKCEYERISQIRVTSILYGSKVGKRKWHFLVLTQSEWVCVCVRVCGMKPLAEYQFIKVA